MRFMKCFVMSRSASRYDARVSESARVLFNADVRALDERNTRCDAIAWRDGAILAVGSVADVVRVAGDGCERVDLGGRAVLPGFIDAHHHPSIVALYGGVVRLTAPAVTDIASLQRALREAAKTLEPGRWLVASEWDELLLPERRPPTRDELDDAVPDRPVFAMHYTCHRAVANSRALELAGIGRDTAAPAGGVIGRGAGGLPDGLLIERGMSRVESLARADLAAHDAEGFLARLGDHHRAMLSAGITRVVDATVPADLATLYREAARRGVLSVPTVMFPVSTTGYLEAPWDALDGPVTGDGDDLLSVGALKLVLDGAPACAMCLGWWQTAGAMVNTWALALRERSLDPLRAAFSLAPKPGRALRTGVRIFGRDEARDVVRAAADRGFALALHAIGNEAVDIALSAFEAAGPSIDRKGAPRIEHGTFLSPSLVRRIADSGAAVVTQPHFMSLPAYESAASIPDIRNAPLRWLLDVGVTVAASSDHPVAGYAPLDGVRDAVSRRTPRGREYEPDQRVTLDEALAMYTRHAASVCGCLDRCGSLEAGKRADLVVLDGPLASASHLANARVSATVLAGETVFGNLSPRSV